MSGTTRPAFYALAPGGWRDYVTLLHPPYTLWHLSYVAIGAALAPHFKADVLGFGLLAFFLGMGVAGHALDELNGRPLQTRIGDTALVALAVASLAGAAAIGVAVAVRTSLWLLVFVAAGTFIAVAYNLELFGGRFHGDAWFAADWGAFPLLTAYLAMAGDLRLPALLGAAFAFALSLAQRRLSTPVRHVRRRVAAVRGELVGHDGAREQLDRARLIAADEAALRLLTSATVTLALAMVAARLLD
jgi:hypothetical protein